MKLYISWKAFTKKICLLKLWQALSTSQDMLFIATPWILQITMKNMDLSWRKSIVVVFEFRTIQYALGLCIATLFLWSEPNNLQIVDCWDILLNLWMDYLGLSIKNSYVLANNFFNKYVHLQTPRSSKKAEEKVIKFSSY